MFPTPNSSNSLNEKERVDLLPPSPIETKVSGTKIGGMIKS